MRSALCKIWNFVLSLFTDVVDAIAYGIKTFGEVLVPVLGALGQVIGDTIGSVFGGSNLLVWGAAGVFLLLFLKQKNGSSNAQPMRTVYDERSSVPASTGGLTV